MAQKSPVFAEARGFRRLRPDVWTVLRDSEIVHQNLLLGLECIGRRGGDWFDSTACGIDHERGLLQMVVRTAFIGDASPEKIDPAVLRQMVDDLVAAFDCGCETGSRIFAAHASFSPASSSCI